MKNAILLHGTGGNPDNFWFAWLREQLTEQGFKVTAPQMPDADHPNLEVWTPFALRIFPLRCRNHHRGHSAGCPLTLQYWGSSRPHPPRRPCRRLYSP